MAEELGARYGDQKQFKNLLSTATATPYAFLYLDLYGKPAKAYKNFNECIYTAPDVLTTNFVGEELPEGMEEEEEL